jgi:hypothetical protein
MVAGARRNRAATEAWSTSWSNVMRMGAAVETSMVLRLVCSRPPLRAQFRLTTRPTTRDDLFAAREAEARGRAAGMATLAEKCGQIWTIEATAESGAIDAAYLTFAAICASIALGPVLPPDGATLFGVRGAIERRDKAIS